MLKEKCETSDIKLHCCVVICASCSMSCAELHELRELNKLLELNKLSELYELRGLSDVKEWRWNECKKQMGCVDSL